MQAITQASQGELRAIFHLRSPQPIDSAIGFANYEVAAPVITFQDHQQVEGVGALGHHSVKCCGIGQRPSPPHEVPAFGLILPCRAGGGLQF